MPKSKAAQQREMVKAGFSTKSLIDGFKQTSRACNAAWGCATSAPFLLRKAKFVVGPNGTKKRAMMWRTFPDGSKREVPVPQRVARCAKKSPLVVMASAAAKECAAVLEKEANMLRLETRGEKPNAPSLPSLGKGAELMIESTLVAYAQAVFGTALDIKEALGMHKKVTPGCMAAALEIVNAKLFEATTHSPGQIVPKIKPNKHKRAKGGESVIAPWVTGEAPMETGEAA